MVGKYIELFLKIKNAILQSYITARHGNMWKDMAFASFIFSTNDSGAAVPISGTSEYIKQHFLFMSHKLLTWLKLN